MEAVLSEEFLLGDIGKQFNFMDKEAEKKYIEIMRKKSGEERLKIAMDLRKLVLKLAKEGIRNQNPNISSKELKTQLQKRIYGLQLTHYPPKKKS